MEVFLFGLSNASYLQKLLGPCCNGNLRILKSSGLFFNSFKVHLARINAFHPLVDNCMIFTHPITSRFLNGLLRSFPPLMKFIWQWDLNFVLLSLTRPPFDHLATCITAHLSMKVTFLITITLPRTVSELGVLMEDSPYTSFHK